jgi:hypothetical protein
MTSPQWVIASEVERPEIHNIESLFIGPMKSYSDETFLQDVLAPDIEFDHSVAELNAVEPGPARARAGLFVKADRLPPAIDDMFETAIENSATFAILQF